MDLLERYKEIGLSAIRFLADLGYNFFFRSLNDWLAIDVPLIGNMSGFEFTILGGLTVWLAIKIVQWLI